MLLFLEIGTASFEAASDRDRDLHARLDARLRAGYLQQDPFYSSPHCMPCRTSSHTSVHLSFVKPLYDRVSRYCQNLLASSLNKAYDTIRY